MCQKETQLFEIKNALNAPFLHFDVSALMYPILTSPYRPTQFSCLQLVFS